MRRKGRATRDHIGLVGAVGLFALLTLAGCDATSRVAASPTNTPIFSMLPTSTPLPTPSDPAGQALLYTARAAVGSAAHSVDITYDRVTGNLTVTITITGVPPDSDTAIAAAYTRVKMLSFQEMSSLWASGQPLKQVTVDILGPAQDEYDIIYPQDYSIATLSAATARRISWASATPASAWALYDNTFLRTSFTVFDDVPAAPTATPRQAG